MQMQQKNNTITVTMETALTFTGNCSAYVALMSTFSSSSNMAIKHFPPKILSLFNKGPCVTSGHLPCPSTLYMPLTYTTNVHEHHFLRE